MVNFNNETTVGIPAADIERVSILQRRHDLIEAYEAYNKSYFSGSAVSISTVKARLISLFLQIQAAIKRRWKEKDYIDFKEKIENADEPEEILKIIMAINDELDEMRLTRIDTHTSYNPADTERENEIKGY